jgi:hypothetical protein
VLITSRDSLAGLVAGQGAGRLRLDPFPIVEATTLLRALIGARVSAEPEATQRLAELCAFLPLALRIAAERAVARPATSLRELTADLEDRSYRLDALDVGADRLGTVETVFSWSFRHLPAEAARTFRLLGCHPGDNVDRYATAALTGTAPQATRRTLDLLTRVHLVQHLGGDRYGTHDLLRVYAARLAAADGERDAALDRLFAYYVAAVQQAHSALYPAEARQYPSDPTELALPDLTEPATARRWLGGRPRARPRGGPAGR